MEKEEDNIDFSIKKGERNKFTKKQGIKNKL